MDRNQTLGFLLIFLIVILWSVFNKPQEQEIVETPLEENVNTMTEAPNTGTEVITIDSLSRTREDDSSNKFGIFAPAATGESQTLSLVNEKLKVNFDTKGAKIKFAEINDHFKVIGEGEKTKIRLFEDEKNEFSFKLELTDRIIESSDLYYTAQQTENTIRFEAKTTEGGSIVQSYTLLPNSYQLQYFVEFNNLDTYLRNKNEIKLSVVNYLDKLEENVQFEKRFTSVYYKEFDENSDYCSCTSADEDDLSNKKIEWVSFSNQFFNTSIIPTDKPFDGVIASTDFTDNSAEDLKRTAAQIQIPLSGGASSKFAMDLYIGPNEYKRLKAFDNDLEEIIPFGRSIFGDINRLFVRPFFDWLSLYIGSKGIVIILLIFIIKMILYPLTYKMLHSQAKMGALKPHLAELKVKFKDDSQKQQMETMKVYREYGVSPFGGCMPMFLQMPIWYALFRFFPASITFRQEPFLWAADLSSYDVFFHLPWNIPMFGAHLSLFTLLWAVSTVVYTYYNMRHMDMSANPAMKYVQYMMPIMFFVFFNNYASGLTCYMFFSNLFNIAQTVLTKRFIFDDEKIMAELNIQKAKPKKKNSFQSRLEDAMKKQQQVQQDKSKSTPKKSRKP